MRRTSHPELTALCQSCGLCCDGSLFGRVRLEPSEVASARRHRLPVVANGSSFAEPCTALVTRDSHHHCAIYAERPEACRRFACKLYAGHLREPGSIDGRMAVVRRARALLAFLGHAGVSSDEHGNPSWDDEGSTPRIEAWMPVVRELAQILDRDFARATTLDESQEEKETGEWRTSVARVARCRIGKPKVSGRRRQPESRSSRRSRIAPLALRGAEWDHLADELGARVERIPRGVGRWRVARDAGT
jgi:Fe-S-cluster containining protein